MSSVTIADKLRDLGVGPGSIIEIGYRSDGIDANIAEAINEEMQSALGWLLEVTAIGEKYILAYQLEGAKADCKTKYSEVEWVRYRNGEGMFCDCLMLNVVGRKVGDKIEWARPDWVNIYTRLQGKT
jgi:hypothetical protein